VGIAATLRCSTVRQSHTKRRLPAGDLRGGDRDMPADPGGSTAGKVRRGHLVWPCLPTFLTEIASSIYRVDTEGSRGQLPSGKPVDACSPNLETFGDCRRP
jgi:hypothetical protein